MARATADEGGRSAEVRDVLIIGGGPAGLSAALTLVRQRRRVTVVDAGSPRNAPADGVHGLLALDGTPPGDLLARGRNEVEGYGGEIFRAETTIVRGHVGGFEVVLDDGRTLRGRRMIIATGLVDELPDVPGLRAHWGKDLLHCAFCHGWESRDRRIGILATGPMAVHQARMFRHLSEHVTFLANGHEYDTEARAELDAVDIPFVASAVAGLELVDDQLRGVRLTDGRLVEVDVVAVTPRMVARAEPFAGIGIDLQEHPSGSSIAADAAGRTHVVGVWVAGNATDPFAQVSGAIADGARVAAQVHADLLSEATDRVLEGSTRSGARP